MMSRWLGRVVLTISEVFMFVAAHRRSDDWCRVNDNHFLIGELV